MPPDVLVPLAVVFVAIALLTGLSTSLVLTANLPSRRRLREIVGPESTGGLDKDAPLAEVTDQKWQRIVSVVPRSPRQMGRLHRRLALAGCRSPAAAVTFSLAEMLTPVIFGVVPLMLFGFHDVKTWAAAVLSASVGFFIPGLVLERAIATRKRQIRNGLPDVLDLMIVCLEAGSSLDQAIVKATEELHIAYPALADELRLVITETRAGKPRLEAFKNLADRTREEEIRALVAMLVQTDRFGTSVAQTLRTFAETSRTKRRQRAEERAAKVSVKLVFPLVFCLFPALYVVILGPAVVQYVRVFVNQVMQQTH